MRKPANEGLSRIHTTSETKPGSFAQKLTFYGTACLIVLAVTISAEEGELKLELTPTIHCVGIRIRDVGTEITGARVRFKQESQTDWQEAQPLVVALGNRLADKGREGPESEAAWEDSAPIIRRLHGSIFWLAPKTAYTVEVILTNAAGEQKGFVTGRVETLPDHIQYGTGRVLQVGQGRPYDTIVSALKEAKPGDTVLVAPGVYRESVWLAEWPSGLPGRPITLRAQKGAVLDGHGVSQIADVHAGIYINSAHDIIVEGFLVKRFGYCIFVKNSQRIVIQRNYIDLTVSAKHAPYGIRMKRCTDSLLQFNSIREPELGEHDYARYPFSIDLGRRNIIRYNQMLGGACHDIITTRGNSDTDIYGNVLRGEPADDGVELEGGTCINLRFFHNIVHCPNGKKATISTTPVTVGPVYVVRNVFVCSQQAIKFANDGTINALKAGHKLCDFAPLFFYHNVFYNPKDSFFRFLGCHGRPILINNIIWGKTLPDVSKNLAAERSSHLYAQVVANYNVYWDGGKTTTSPTPTLDQDSIFADPLFVNPSDEDFRLQPHSPAIDKAMPLPNINDLFTGNGPDIGCFELGLCMLRPMLHEPLRDDPR